MKKLLSVIAAILFAATSFAQVDEVTLTTIGTGRTEDEATLRALRNALEQTFGTFVSENTSIVNDELVRDEIATTSKGNVKEFKKLSVVQLPNKNISVTLKATISVNKLIKYARNNGSRAEFAGQTYAMNVKLLKLQQQNANKTLDVMKDNVITLCQGVFDYDIKLGEVKKQCFTNHNDDYILPFSLDVYATDVTSNIYSLITETLDAMRMSSSMVQDFDRNKLEHFHDLPVPYSKLNEIEKSIQNAIVKDFLKVKLKKIGDNECFYFSKIQDKNNAIHYDYCNYSTYRESSSYMWFISSKQPIKLVHAPANSSGHKYQIGNSLNVKGSNPNLYHILFPCAGINNFSRLSNWNTNADGQIHQKKLCSFDLCILLTDAELERFNGLELDGVTSPKYTSAPKPDIKKDAVKGYKKMSGLSLNSPVKIKRIRVITTDLPKKTYTIQMTRKDPSSGKQTYKIQIGAKKQECLYWEFNGDAIASAFANAIEGKSNNGYIEFNLVYGEYTIKKFPEELSEFVYVQ